MGTAAVAASNNTSAPIDLDSPDTAVDSAEAQAAVSASDAAAAAIIRVTPSLASRVGGTGDAQFRSLFSAWQQMDGAAAQAIAIPSRRPINEMRMTSSFGTRSDPFSGRRARHNGIDIAVPAGTPIYATADGVVGRAQWVGGYGNYAEIDHGNGISTLYAHNSQLVVDEGQTVAKGQTVARCGSTGYSTGPHLHFEVRQNGSPVNPLITGASRPPSEA